ncbi:hypothetical protein [Sulfurimonas sp.]|uniref:hypothetical protein n=1 Tax=Sulfurimonas sp. TaxID=2022749 RepID=UPI0026278F26|nr:hypothetical protein [Sulfurimonas sp.]MDD3452573.1 hypothetical protein [Sulfurimonas sp.]
MGYHRPVESFNIGKKGEHQERQFFSEKQNKERKICFILRPVFMGLCEEQNNETSKTCV